MYFNSLCSKFDVNSIDRSPVYEHWQTLLHEVTGNRPCFSPQHMYRYSNLCSLFPQDLEFYAATVEFESSPVFSKIWRGDFSNTVVVFSSPLLESDARHCQVASVWLSITVSAIVI